MNSYGILKMACVNLLPYSCKLRGDFHRTLLYSINLGKRKFISSAGEFLKMNERHFKSAIWRFVSADNFRGISTSAADTENSVNSNTLNYNSVVRECIKLIRQNNVNDNNLTSYGILDKLSKIPGISPKKRVELAETLIKSIMSKKNVTLTEEHYIGLLKCYLESKCLDSMVSLFHQMISSGIQPSPQSHLLMLKCLAENGNHEKMKTMVENLEKQGIKNDEMYGSVIYSVILSRGLNDAVDEVEILKSKNIPVGSYVYTSLLKGAIINEDRNQLQKISDDILITDVEFSQDQILSLVETAILNNKLHLLKMLQICQGTVLVNIAENIVVKLLHCEGIEYAFSALKSIISLSESLSSDKELLFKNNLCKKFLQQLGDMNCPLYRKIEICLQLRQENLYEYAFEFLLQEYLRNNHIKSSLLIFKSMYENNISILPHYFWPLFIQMGKKFGDKGLIEIIHKMYEFNIVPDIDTMKLIIYPNMSRKTLHKNVMNLSNEKLNDGLVQETFIEFALENGYFEECKKFVNEHPLSRRRNYDVLANACEKALCKFPPNPEAVTIVKMVDALDPGRVLAKLFNIHDLNKMKSLLESFCSNNMYIQDKATVKALLNAENIEDDIKASLQQLLNWEATVVSKTPKDIKKKPSAYMNFQEVENAEIHLAELEAKNFRTTGQKLRLFKLYIQNQMFGKAIKMRDEIIKHLGNDMELTPQYLIHFCKCASYENDLDSTVHYYEQLRQRHPHIQLDVPKAIDLALFFLRKGRMNEMADALQNVAVWNENIEYLERKIVGFLREVASLGNIKLTRTVFNKFVQKDFLKLSSNSLHVFTKTYLDANDINGAAEEYMRIVDKFNIHSNLYMLMFKILEADRLDLFDKIINVTTESTHFTYKYEVVEAIAHVGKMNILPRYLQQFGFDVDDEKFANYLRNKKYVDTTAFKNLIKAAIEMNTSYEKLIETTIKVLGEKRDREGLLDLFAYLKSNRVQLKRNAKIQFMYLKELFDTVDVGKPVPQ